MTHNGHQTADPVRVAAESEAARVVMLVQGKRERLHDVVRDLVARLLRESGAVVQVDDDSPFCRPRVSWPGPGPARPTGIGPIVVGLWCGAASFVGYVLAKWVA
jgi:hypothetical protein